MTPPTPVEFHVPEREPKIHKAIWVALVGAVTLIVSIALTAHHNVRSDLADLSHTVSIRGETLAVISAKADDVSVWRKEVDVWRKDVDARLIRIEAATNEIRILLKRR